VFFELQLRTLRENTVTAYPWFDAVEKTTLVQLIRDFKKSHSETLRSPAKPDTSDELAALRKQNRELEVLRKENRELEALRKENRELEAHLESTRKRVRELETDAEHSYRGAHQGRTKNIGTIKEDWRKVYKDIALALHPDKNGEECQVNRTNAFKAAASLNDYFKTVV
jgi:hypothetical protein